jgi:hypothetical protein
MTGARNWSRALARKRAAASLADQRAADAHLRAVEAGGRVERRPDKAELRAIADQALAEFSGPIRRIPARRQG